jgi:hypothetical protein
MCGGKVTTATVDAQGNLTMTGTGSVVGAHTITIAAAALLPGIYSCNPPYRIDGRPGHFDNTVYDAVIRDVRAGFNLGFVASATTDPSTGNPGHAGILVAATGVKSRRESDAP